MTFMPDDLSRGMVSGDGASTKSTCPASKAAARVVASGIGSSTSRSCLGTRCGFQYSAFLVSSSRSRGMTRVVHGMEPRCLVVDQALDVPHHEIGGQRAAVVELHALAQLDEPLLVVGGIDQPFGGEPRRERRLAIRAREIPVDERVIE